MKDSLAAADVKELANSTLSGFDQRVAALPCDLQAPFYDEAMRLEAELLALYRVVALMVRKEEDMDRIAGLWGTMVAECDRFAARLHELNGTHPECGAAIFYDRVLDLRSKCQRLQQMHS